MSEASRRTLTRQSSQSFDNINTLSQNDLLKLLRVKEMESVRLRKSVESLSSQERSLSLEYEDCARQRRREEESRVKGELGSTKKEEEERNAVKELKRVENRVKILDRALDHASELVTFVPLLDEIQRTKSEIRIAEEGVRGLVG
eukprot:CAMPEP_0118645448 /NCGR_PEP_ID=MMETSP0785-20121206/7512_1 /TAXON_ID=91992 /ORGANISM="Bolidomonas pacifica, Strain CCMP 1866" /LENGTH=144 /DNA_ID=CAMNT_0006537343 /DNA_START=238 /DNA_END=668 /DNA_ORIENTATION=+